MQLRALGVPEQTIDRWLAVGRLHRVQRRVYALGHPLLPASGAERAAVMSASTWDPVGLRLRGSAVSHQTAGLFHQLVRWWSGPVHVTSVRRVRLEGCVVHTVRSLDALDVTAVDGVPTTTWARTLLDLGEVLEHRWLVRALEQSVIHEHYVHQHLEAAIARGTGRHGIAAVRAALATGHHLRPQMTRSLMEDLFLFLVREADPALPALPTMNGDVVMLGGERFEIDAIWFALKVAVELDSRFHDPAGPRLRDRSRDRELRRDGYLTYRFRWADVVGRPRWVLWKVRDLLARAAIRRG
jgi:hypothetical protein